MKDLTLEKGLPANTDAERLILGSVMLDDANYPRVAEVLQDRDFSLEKHRRIWLRMRDLYGRGVRIDRITLADELSRAGQLQSVDGLSYLSTLDEGLPEIQNLESYIEIVHECSKLRRVIFTMQRGIDRAILREEQAGDILASVENEITSLNSEQATGSLESVRAITEDSGGVTGILYPDRIGGAAVPSPWRELNEKLEGGGFMPGSLNVIGARPSLGKTAIACQCTDFVADKGGEVIVFTLEMNRQQWIRRMMFTRARVDSLRFSRGEATATETMRCDDALRSLMKLPVHISSKIRTVAGMRSAARAFQVRRPLSLVVIDYLQLITAAWSKGMTRNDQVSQISRDLKLLAEELRCPILLLAQLNRKQVEEKREPVPSDLRDSGSIEQDADLILLPYACPGQDIHELRLNVDLIIGKQRNGAVGKVPMIFNRQITRYGHRDEAAAGGWQQQSLQA